MQDFNAHTHIQELKALKLVCIAFGFGFGFAAAISLALTHTHKHSFIAVQFVVESFCPTVEQFVISFKCSK